MPTAAPVLRYAGGKQRMLPQLLPHFPAGFARYVEPFAGGAAVFFSLRVRGFAGPAFLSDVNRPLIVLYEQLRDHCTPLGRLYEALIRDYESSSNKEAWFYRARDHWLDPQDDLMLAARLLIMNNLTHAGLFRLSSSGQYNAPFDLSLIMGRGRRPPFKKQAQLEAASRALQGVVLRVQGFDVALLEAGELIRKDGEPTFVYCDSPYSVPPGTNAFTSYQAAAFGPVQQAALRDSAAAAHEAGAQIILSNADTPEVQELYADRDRWDIHAASGARAVDRKPGFAKEAKEVIIIGRSRTG